MTKLYMAETGAGTEATDVKHLFLQIIATFTGIRGYALRFGAKTIYCSPLKRAIFYTPNG